MEKYLNKAFENMTFEEKKYALNKVRETYLKLFEIYERAKKKPRSELLDDMSHLLSNRIEVALTAGLCFENYDKTGDSSETNRKNRAKRRAKRKAEKKRRY